MTSSCSNKASHSFCAKILFTSFTFSASFVRSRWFTRRLQPTECAEIKSTEFFKVYYIQRHSSQTKILSCCAAWFCVKSSYETRGKEKTEKGENATLRKSFMCFLERRVKTRLHWRKPSRRSTSTLIQCLNLPILWSIMIMIMIIIIPTTFLPHITHFLKCARSHLGTF